MLTKEFYIKILKENKNTIDWYGEKVPKELFNSTVKLFSENLIKEIKGLEEELEFIKLSVTKEKKQGYINSLWLNLKNSPYTLNGDVYLKIKKSVDNELNKVLEEKKVTKDTKKKKTTNKKKTTKNSSVIFGNK
tara:strand:- start:1086 stop:1487 length:402 start_codon:yes stop_codon:yes gene_type:complete